MASFCKQCSIDIWGEDDKDFAGVSTTEDTADRRFVHVLCEDCGPTLVDHEGTCVSVSCLKRHGATNESD